MAYFDPELDTEIEVDASPVGLAGILTQGGKVIAYGSRSLSDAETRYSQTEREALRRRFGRANILTSNMCVVISSKSSPTTKP